ncbi:MAG TPA: Hpt domain-containing protein [Xanthobacteraceae bacterium]|jgi:chemotaxis protein histidine kinase CheA|nr:Hpt domain-containing protein [Xanthobacteraceae bacterium]
MAKTNLPNPRISETQYDDHTVIVPPNRLKSFVSRTGDSMEIATDPIARAETALNQIKKEFRGWMNAECDTLEAVRGEIREKGKTPALIEQLFNSAHDVIGHADVFGYPLAGKIADSLCQLITRAPDTAHIPMTLIDAHVDAVRAVVREGVHQADDRTGNEIYRRLGKLVREYLAKSSAKTGDLASLPKVAAPKL